MVDIQESDLVGLGQLPNRQDGHRDPLAHLEIDTPVISLISPEVDFLLTEVWEFLLGGSREHLAILGTP